MKTFKYSIIHGVYLRIWLRVLWNFCHPQALNQNTSVIRLTITKKQWLKCYCIQLTFHVWENSLFLRFGIELLDTHRNQQYILWKSFYSSHYITYIDWGPQDVTQYINRHHFNQRFMGPDPFLQILGKLRICMNDMIKFQGFFRISRRVLFFRILEEF